MKKDISVLQNLKCENRNKIFNQIRMAKQISGSELSYDLHLSRPTVTQNIEELKVEGLIYESGSLTNTGGRNAKTFSVAALKKAAIGLDITRNHVTVCMVDLMGECIYEKRVRCPFALDEEYKKKLAELIHEALESKGICEEQVLGVGIVVPGLITEDYQSVFCGKILNFTGLTMQEFQEYIPFACRFYNDADAAGYAEISLRQDVSDCFYISLSNNVGGAVIIDNKVYKGEGLRSGEIGHMTIYPDGKECYCGKKGCFEVYCNAMVLAECTEGRLETFFEGLQNKDAKCLEAWKQYLETLSIAVNNVRMLFDCKVILGGYVGAYLEEYFAELKELAAKRNTFENTAEYLLPCKIKKDALALGGALPFIHEFWKSV